MQTLVTRNGTVSFDGSTATVVEGGALRIEQADGTVDLIGPGYWVAVIGDDSQLTWETLAQ